MANKAVKRNDTVSSPILTEKTITTKPQQLIGTLISSSLHSSPLPTIPFDLIPEILHRLPVKPLMQFRCVCKWWNSLISDPKFAKKHFLFSTTCLIHILAYSSLSHKYIIKSYPLDSLFTKDVACNKIAQHEIASNHSIYNVGSCNGIICVAEYHIYERFVIYRLWNPSIRKFKELPPLELQHTGYNLQMHGFGHDPISDNYKVVVVFRDHNKTDVKVLHNVGTNIWKDIKETFQYDGFIVEQKSGKYVNGAINWLASKDYSKGQRFIASFDLGNESYKKVLLPDYDYRAIDSRTLHLSVFRNCLCWISSNDVWIMKEYGMKASWTKLFTIPFMPSYYFFANVMHIFEDGLVTWKSTQDSTRNLVFYNSTNGSVKFSYFQFKFILEVCVESLVSPYS
ncbi:putative F-box domain-containing protein [Medicago truncatula]|uniref:F-box protein interaction domain protein n=1 Tax=Medicago truncatula TaxID=3880 RepID=G7JX96_MEDTR|nr:F-box/kelch-repeat protein At3g23880 [Medicago truncatula]AES97652.1 F-box protein interaction domain protein [Medicago truncatula]RHN55930.1 putative F-box domain-containing protein [Medicago truncatula]